ncbi:MAG: hypothetical protein LBE80_05300 [Deltaproteobacteria bacterium]|jgi:hypothetical protein|nr:hypothetical protein [Deltaproteobacteria bacterium]
MSIDSISLNNNILTSEPDHDAVVTKEQLTYAMIEAFWQKEAGQVLKNKMDEVISEIMEAVRLWTAAENIYFRPALTRVEQKKQDVIDNEFAVKLSEYMTERGLPYKGGADPTVQEWADNAEVIKKYVAEVLDPKQEEVRHDTLKAVAEYETALRLANIQGVLIDPFES